MKHKLSFQVELCGCMLKRSLKVRGLFLCMKYEIQQMLTQGSGVIVNNSSTNGLGALPGISPYVASKHAVTGLT
jgi:NAD(P)-dependent dehydrogenase (short-subunit alcohol dehydrogenase family)